MEIVQETLTALWQVIVAGIIFGAGLPALFALGLKAMNSGRTVNADGSISGQTAAGGRITGSVIFGLVIAIALFGIVVIVFGKQIFAH